MFYRLVSLSKGLEDEQWGQHPYKSIHELQVKELNS